ncbi:ABC transporter permease [Elioraea rosea]|uniref:ABC transporter permease n=1 Tax=Elioraea rosea TaxID=2492390 RepID=UPI00118217A2|nr:iron ABC transporter permease [Elioraea rosea]
MTATATVAGTAPSSRPRLPSGWTVAALVAAAAVASPLIAVLAGAVAPAGEVWRQLAETVLAEFVLNSILLSAGTAALAITIGAGTAWLVTMHDFPGRRVFEVALLLTLAMPAYLIGYVYTDMLDVTGPVQSALRAGLGVRFGEYWFPEIRSLGGAVLMFGLVLYPYVYLLCRAAFLEQSVCLTEVARTLGCSRMAMIRRVALPLARPAIAAGAALAVMEALADFGTVQHFAVRTFTTGIYQAWFQMGDRTAAQQLAACLMGVVATLLLLERLARGPRRFFNTSSKHQAITLVPMAGLRAAGATLACALPVLLGFAVPALRLAQLALEDGDSTLHVLPFARHSIVLAALAAALAVAVAVVMAYGARLRATATMRAAVTVASLGYAVPGSVIAVGVLVPFGLFDNALDRWMRAQFGISTGLLLSGTIAALVFAYVARFLAVALSTVEAGLARIRPSVEDAARVLGRGPAGSLAAVHAPLIRGSLLSAALLVFVDTMKELPATLIVRPFDFDTLAVRVYNLASDERLAQASTAALVIVAAGLIPVAILARAMKRAGHD